jgi:2',3'-cyclic-nucleotide 2'-phosphodiesterase (5'-nucleotidase family)
MKIKNLYCESAIIICFIFCFIGCSADDIVPVPQSDESVVGFTTVDLDANKPVVRGREAVIGNLIADSFLFYALEEGYDVDFAMANGGNIRFNSTTRPNGIYPIGDITQNDINEILPFNNTGIIVEITGLELKSTLERSVHALPIPEGSSGNGAFAHLSSGVQIFVDTSLQAQIIDELNNAESIAIEGNRVVQVTINGELLDLQRNYLVLIPSFAAGGGDAFVMLGAISDDKKTDLAEPLKFALQKYLETNSPVTPIIENRIIVD